MKKQMQKQQGMTFIGLVLMIAMIVFVAVIGMKVAPFYMEYASVKKAIKKAAEETKNESKSKVISAFSKSIIVDDIKSVTANDIEITKSDTGTVISVDYEVVVPLFANVSALLDFSASSEE